MLPARLGAFRREGPDLAFDFVEGGEPDFSRAGDRQHKESERQRGGVIQGAEPAIEFGGVRVCHRRDMRHLVPLFTHERLRLNGRLQIDVQAESHRVLESEVDPIERFSGHFWFLVPDRPERIDERVLVDVFDGNAPEFRDYVQREWRHPPSGSVDL